MKKQINKLDLNTNQIVKLTKKEANGILGGVVPASKRCLLPAV
jgi:hypothetical protein